MRIETIKVLVRRGMYHDARQLIEQESIDSLMSDDHEQQQQQQQKQQQSTSTYYQQQPSHQTNQQQQQHQQQQQQQQAQQPSMFASLPVFDRVPLLVMFSLINDEAVAISMSRLLLEKGYLLSQSDANGLCALNYAIALRRHRLVELYLNTFNCELDKYRDCYDNTFLHYVFATGDHRLIDLFSATYRKYYKWSPHEFKHILNCDGLSVQDLVDHTFAISANGNSPTATTAAKQRGIAAAAGYQRQKKQQTQMGVESAFITSSPNVGNTSARPQLNTRLSKQTFSIRSFACVERRGSM